MKEKTMEIQQTTTTIVEQLNRSEIDTQIATAKRYPRSIKEFISQATAMVTMNDKVAAECIYSLPRAGKTIEGASSRFAEVMASAWGNCRAGARVIAEENGFVVAQGVFHDLQSNNSVTFEVRRSITNKKGQRYQDDMIGMTANAACSIALRNAVLKGIPKAYWSEMYDRALEVVRGDAKTLVKRRDDAMAYLLKMGVTEKMILETLEIKGVQDIDLDHLVTLRGLTTAIKAGDTTIDEAFSKSKKEEKPVQTISDLLADKPIVEHVNLDTGEISEEHPVTDIEALLQGLK